MLLLLFYFAKVLLLYFEIKKHIEVKLCLFLETTYSKLVFICFVGVYLSGSVILQGYISLHNTSPQITKATGCEILLFVILHSTRKNRLVMNQYSFLQAMNLFSNAIVSGLFTLKTLKSQKNWLFPLKPYQGFFSDPNNDCNHLFSLTKLNLLP